MGGYRSLIVYQQAVLIYDFTHKFCQNYLDVAKDRRTIEQMVQAARSGKQNIVEGSLEKSLKMNIKLTGVARASFGELLEDYKDFLRVRGLKLWDKDDERLTAIRQMRIAVNESNESNGTNWTNILNKTDWSYWTNETEKFANLMITLISKENYLLDKMLQVLEAKFIKQGGYSENLSKKREEEKKRKFARLIGLIGLVSLIGLMGFNTAYAVSNTGLVGYWSFNEGKGTTATDFSGNGNKGTLTNGPTWVKGRFGKALKFDGVDDYVVIDSVANDLSGDLTISVWVKANNNHTFINNKGGVIIGHHDSAGNNKGVILFVGDQTSSANDNKLMVYDGTSGAFEITTNTVVGDNTWHHIVYTRSGSTGTVYVDGVSKGTHIPNWTYASTDKWSIGQEWDLSVTSDFIDGLIDDVRIYNRALSASEIQTLYKAGAAKHNQ